MINSDYWKIFDDWIEKIPKTTSHYKYETVKKSYFESSELTITKLYNLFFEFLTAVYGFEPKLTFNTFREIILMIIIISVLVTQNQMFATYAMNVIS